jgi:hypothetical protein
VLCADPSYDLSGALAPAQAFDPKHFLDGLARTGLGYELDPDS